MTLFEQDGQSVAGEGVGIVFVAAWGHLFLL